MPALSSLRFALGDLVLGIEDPTGRWRGALLPRYGAFESALEPEVVLDMEAKSAHEPDGPALVERLAGEPVRIELDGARLTLASASIHGAIDLERGRGRLAAPLHRHGVDVAARALLAVLRPDALLVHAALALDGDRTFVLAGPSGVGKSTIAALLGERALCDELVRLDRGGSGWRATALPFWHGRSGGGELAAIRLLRQAPRDGRRELPHGEVVRRLSAEIVWPSFSEARVGRALARFERLTAEVPIDELGFRPTPAVWPHVTGAAA